MRWGVLLLIHLLASNIRGAVLHVNSIAPAGGDGLSWAAAFPKIQDAINAASQNDEIWVAAGIYRENIELRDGISLFGGFSGLETNRAERNWNIHSTVVDGGDTNRALNVPFISQPTRLDGFVIRNGRADFGAGIYSAGGEFVSSNNLILQNNGEGVFGGGGVFVDETVRFPAQEPITFFTNLANRLLHLHSPELSVDRIQIYPTNDYTPEVHRRLQLAANIYDATTNRGGSYPYFPSVFRPVFTNDGGKILICGYVEATDDLFLTNQWLTLESAEDRDALTNAVIASKANIFGQPIVIGAKKGFPNFNEFSIETFAQVSRHLELRKLSTNSLPYQTNQLYRLQITNIFGVESWNSYVQPFSRPLELRVSHTFTASITDETGAIIWPTNGNPFVTNFIPPAMVISNWPGAFSGSNAFSLPYFTNLAAIPLSQYSTTAPHFRPASTNFESNSGFPIPQWTLHLSNRIQYAAIDDGRVVDFVTLDGPNAPIDLTRSLLGQKVPIPPGFSSEPTIISAMWRANRLDASTNLAVPTEGIRQQIQVSRGTPLLDDGYWNGYSAQPIANKQKAMAEFAKFMGLTPQIPGYQNIPMPPYLITQAPFSPMRKIYSRISLQANDPLVHFQMSDLVHGSLSTSLQAVIPPAAPPPFPSGLKQMNEFCRPFPQRGFNRYPESYPTPGNAAFQDKEIGWSQAWDFSDGNHFNLRWLDRIHRGTPWQTIYTGANAFSPSSEWENWSGSAETHPSNDWKIVEMFLAERDSLGTPLASNAPVFINNTIANNSASAGGAVSFAASATLHNNIITENSSGLFRLPVTNAVSVQTNCVSGNAQYDYENFTDVSGNLSLNPQFVSSGSGNFHLLAISPCVDSATDIGFATGWLLNEPARFQGGAVDLGAFELSTNEPPVFLPPQINAAGQNQITFHVAGFAGEKYAIEISEDLVEWIPVSTNASVNGLFTIFNVLSESSNRFFRAVRVP